MAVESMYFKERRDASKMNATFKWVHIIYVRGKGWAKPGGGYLSSKSAANKLAKKIYESFL